MVMLPHKIPTQVAERAPYRGFVSSFIVQRDTRAEQTIPSVGEEQHPIVVGFVEDSQRHHDPYHNALALVCQLPNRRSSAAVIGPSLSAICRSLSATARILAGEPISCTSV